MKPAEPEDAAPSAACANAGDENIESLLLSYPEPGLSRHEAIRLFFEGARLSSTLFRRNRQRNDRRALACARRAL
jgi:hypothetical protein